eukprot:scaffold12168_cov74-Skeletonema_dohrnii-CCMP3373.AAC.1
MSEVDDNAVVHKSCCASCGIAEVDDIELKTCADCDLVKYCSIKCQKEHRPQHKEACEKRAAELRDELLFRQPESTHLGDCPICMIPLSLDKQNSIMASCCSKLVCNGCTYANQKREYEGRLGYKCEFCREPTPSTDEQCDEQRMKRVEANDPVAMYEEGFNQHKKGNYSSAVEYYTNAAELGNAAAHYNLSCMYHHGHGVEKDREKEIHHLEEAAIVGHPDARHNLGCIEEDDYNIVRALKHWVIAATHGDDDSMKALMDAFKRGFVGKDVLAATLRAHKAAIDATKSTQRDTAEIYFRLNAEFVGNFNLLH